MSRSSTAQVIIRRTCCLLLCVSDAFNNSETSNAVVLVQGLAFSSVINKVDQSRHTLHHESPLQPAGVTIYQSGLVEIKPFTEQPLGQALIVT